MKIEYSEKVDGSEGLKKLEEYRHKVTAVVNAANFTENESSLATWQDDLMRSGVQTVTDKIGPVTDLILIGIGGSSLGTEAIYQALKTNESPRLHVLDTVSDAKVESIFADLQGVTKENLAVCAISKSGGTIETLSNISVVFEKLAEQYGETPFDRVVYIGNEGTELMNKMASLGSHVLPMHEAIGGRYSVFTAVGLVPLKLLGFDIDALLAGLKSATCCGMDDANAESAVMLHEAMKAGNRIVNFFAFDIRLERMGAWYRQLVAESIGKEFDRQGNKVELGFVPTISTPVELHSIGQLYFSGFKGVYTDFVSVAEVPAVNKIKKTYQVVTNVLGRSLKDIAGAIESGVVAAYKERELPFKQTIIDRLDEHNLGLLMGSRMLETMYLAELMDVNAFNQPNVELYKVKTKEALDGK